MTNQLSRYFGMECKLVVMRKNNKAQKLIFEEDNQMKLKSKLNRF